MSYQVQRTEGVQHREPEFIGFDELSELVNQLTVCEDHPKDFLDTELE